MFMVILRGAFLILVAAVISLFVGEEFQEQAGFGFGPIATIIFVTVALAASVIAVDITAKDKKLSAVSGIFLGLVAGLLAAYALSFVVDLIGVYITPESDPREAAAMTNLLRGIKVIIGLVTCYVAISLVIQTKDDFRFVIPYVEFAKEVRGSRPTLLDTSVIIDGRILDILETKVMQGVLIVPRFVLDELQTLADSGDKLKRARGRRGLDILQKLQGNEHLEVHLESHDAEGDGVDAKLIDLAQRLKARVMTNDYNLNKVSTLRGVETININDLAKALRPVVLPGEHMHVKLVKPGESPTQGVGYLDDGTMVVVEQGRDHLGTSVDLVVTSTLQTSAGRMIFGRFEHEDDEPADPGEDDGDGPPPNPPSDPTGASHADASGASSSGSHAALSGDSGAPTGPPRNRPRGNTSRRNPRRG